MYLFYLDGVLLPVTPAEMTTRIGTNNKTMELANQGEINLIKFPKLTEYSFEFELPFQKFTWSARDCNPKEILDLLEEAKVKKRVLVFSVIRKMRNKTRFPTQQKVTVEDYDVVEDADNNSDMTVKLNLKMFRPYRTKHLIDPNKGKATQKRDKKEEKHEEFKSTIPTDKSCIKQIELKTNMNIRSGAGTKNRKLAEMKKGDKPYVYGEYNYKGTTWYKIKHSAGDKDKNGTGWAWVSGNPKYTDVLRDFKIERKFNLDMHDPAQYRDNDDPIVLNERFNLDMHEPARYRDPEGE